MCKHLNVFLCLVGRYQAKRFTHLGALFLIYILRLSNMKKPFVVFLSCFALLGWGSTLSGSQGLFLAMLRGLYVALGIHTRITTTTALCKASVFPPEMSPTLKTFFCTRNVKPSSHLELTVLARDSSSGWHLCLLPQASEKHVHFIVSRQIHLQSPDIFQEGNWSSNGSRSPGPGDQCNTRKVRPRQGPWKGSTFWGWLHAFMFLSVFSGHHHTNTICPAKLKDLHSNFWFCKDDRCLVSRHEQGKWRTSEWDRRFSINQIDVMFFQQPF